MEPILRHSSAPRPVPENDADVAEQSPQELLCGTTEELLCDTTHERVERQSVLYVETHNHVSGCVPLCGGSFESVPPYDAAAPSWHPFARPLPNRCIDWQHQDQVRSRSPPLAPPRRFMLDRPASAPMYRGGSRARLNTEIDRMRTHCPYANLPTTSATRNHRPAVETELQISAWWARHLRAPPQPPAPDCSPSQAPSHRCEP